MTMFCQVLCFALFSAELVFFSALFVWLCHIFFFLQYMCHRKARRALSKLVSSKLEGGPAEARKCILTRV
jgi:hypothetical protein